MTLQQVLKEIDVIQKLVCDSTRVDLTYNDVPDDEIKIYTSERNIILHTPTQESPYYFFTVWHGNVDALIRGQRKDVKINY